MTGVTSGRQFTFGRFGVRHLDHEIAGAVDRQAVARAEQHGHRLLLDDRRADDAGAGGQIRARLDGRLEPAALVVPDRPGLFHRARGIADASRARRPFRRASGGASGDAEGGGQDRPIRLYVAVEALIFRFESPPCLRRIEGAFG